MVHSTLLFLIQQFKFRFFIPGVQVKVFMMITDMEWHADCELAESCPWQQDHAVFHWRCDVKVSVVADWSVSVNSSTPNGTGCRHGHGATEEAQRHDTCPWVSQQQLIGLYHCELGIMFTSLTAHGHILIIQAMTFILTILSYPQKSQHKSSD